MKTLDEAMDWLGSLLKFGIKPGLERMEWMLEKLEHPERRLKSVHVAGTNGKGSTVEFLSQIMMEAGHEVGTFTSPHVLKAADRIAVNGEPIPDDVFLTLTNKLRPLVEELGETEYGQATEFEVMTMMAIVYFATVAYPDVVIFEAGLGGRLDSTNVIHPMVCIITNVSEDHTDVLGDTISDIAREKAGIIKSGVPVATAAEGEALSIIEKKAKEKLTKTYRLGHEFNVFNEQSFADGERFDFQSPFSKKESLRIAMKGKHQVQNASLALMVLDYLYFFFGLNVEFEHIQKGLEKAKLKLRFEEIMEKPKLILDGAHNQEAIAKVTDMISERFPNSHIHIIFAALETKNVKTMISSLEKVADEITFTSFSHKKAHRPEKLELFSTMERTRTVDDPKEAIDQAIASSNENTVIIVTGSLYFISEIHDSIL